LCFQLSFSQHFDRKSPFTSRLLDPVGCQGNMSQSNANSWSERLRSKRTVWTERLRSFVGLGKGQRVEQSAPASRLEKARKRRNTKSVKRACNAFSYFIKDQACSMSEFSPENMKVLAEKWINMRQARKEPYERQAEMDARRYTI